MSEAPSDVGPDPDHATTGRLVARMSADLSELVRSEISLAKVELRQSVRHAGYGAGLFGAGGVLALYGLGVLVTAAVLALALVLDAWLAALLVAAVLFILAGGVALVGRSQVAQSAPPVQRSVENVKADADAVRHPGSTAAYGAAETREAR